MFLFFSGMDCKSSNNANKKLIQGKYNFCYFFWHFLKFICEYNTWSDAIDDNLAWNQYQYPTLPYIHNARW